MMDVMMTRAALYFEDDSLPLTVIKTEHHDRTDRKSVV